MLHLKVPKVRANKVGKISNLDSNDFPHNFKISDQFEALQNLDDQVSDR